VDVLADKIGPYSGVLAYLSANFFSALSNTSAKYLTRNGFFPEGTKILDIFLHVNLMNLFFFLIFYFIQKSRDKISFSIKETFFRKDEIIQVLFFAIPILASSYKLYMMEKMELSDIEISAMIKPFCVWALSIMFLNEKFHAFYLKYAFLAVLGFLIANINHIPYKFDFDTFRIVPCFEGYDSKILLFLVSYLGIASIGDTTRRYYCVKIPNAIQAICVEFVMFAFYGVIFLLRRGTFNVELFFNPCLLIISFITLSHHISLIYGVKHAPSVTALEFINFSKVIFVLILSYILLDEGRKLGNEKYIKIVSAVIIAITLIFFNLKIRTVSLQKEKNNSI
jgi:drug/metabolite transporter (DMT)-like permease